MAKRPKRHVPRETKPIVGYVAKRGVKTVTINPRGTYSRSTSQISLPVVRWAEEPTEGQSK